RARALLDEEAAEGADPKRALEIDLRWNALLGEATGNLLYQLVGNLFTKLVARLGPLYYNAERDPQRSMTNHRALLAAVEQRDPAAPGRGEAPLQRGAHPRRGRAARGGRRDRAGGAARRARAGRRAGRRRAVIARETLRWNGWGRLGESMELSGPRERALLDEL